MSRLPLPPNFHNPNHTSVIPRTTTPPNLTLPPPNPERNLSLRRQPPKRKIAHIRLRLEPFLSAQLYIVRRAQQGKGRNHLLLGKVAARAHALAAAVGDPGAGEAFQGEFWLGLGFVIGGRCCCV